MNIPTPRIIIPDDSKTVFLIKRVADATIHLQNREAWAAIGELLGEAGVPSSDQGHARTAAWTVRAQLRQHRHAHPPRGDGGDGR